MNIQLKIGKIYNDEDFIDEVNDLQLIKVICNVNEVDFEQLTKRFTYRKREFVECRQMYFYFKKRMSNLSLEKIGSFFNKDHATVLHSVKSVNNLIDTDANYRARVNKIKTRIKNSIIESSFSKTDEIINRVSNKYELL